MVDIIYFHGPVNYNYLDSGECNKKDLKIPGDQKYLLIQDVHVQDADT